jgi:hypothetical protein
MTTTVAFALADEDRKDPEELVTCVGQGASTACAASQNRTSEITSARGSGSLSGSASGAAVACRHEHARGLPGWGSVLGRHQST